MKAEVDKTGRREFLARAAGLLAATAGSMLVAAEGPSAEAAEAPPVPLDREAGWYEHLTGGAVQCGLCPRACRVAKGMRGQCGVRENRDGTYRTLVFGRACAVHVDPIEKKPFYHYLPGTSVFSLGTAGCNLHCKFCQNWEISQARPEDVAQQSLPPETVVDFCRKRALPTVACTYNEPTVFSEYVLEIARLARAQKVGAVTVSNGFISRRALVDLCRQLTAVKIDLKAFQDKFYRDVCSGSLQPVLDTLTTLHELGMHFEIVVLLIPTLNDGRDEVRRMCTWVVKELGPDVPVHFSRFTPLYKMTNLPPTPVATLEAAYEEARAAGVNFCYLGNVGAHKWANTYCPGCGRVLIERLGNLVRRNDLKDGKCPGCGRAIPGVWTQEQALAFEPKPVKA